MAPPCAAQSKSYQGPLTMSGDSDTRHMPSLAHDAKRPRAFLKQPTHSICIFFTPPAGMWASSRVQFLRGWDQIFLFFSPLSCWQGDPGEAGLVKRLHKGARESTIQCRQWAIIQWTIWARDVHGIQLLRHLRLPAGNLQLKQDLTQNMIWDLMLHHNARHDTLFTLGPHIRIHYNTPILG